MEELIEMLKGVIESNTEAMKESAAASKSMAAEVTGLRRTIQAAQHKIGGELGPIMDRQKDALKKLNDEVAKARGEDVAS
jgi:hypothetical protein